MNLNRNKSTFIPNPKPGIKEIRIDYDSGMRTWVVFEIPENSMYWTTNTLHFSTEEHIAQAYPSVALYLKELAFNEELKDIINE